MALQFYEKVEVVACPKFPDRIGKFGHILGASYEDETPDDILAYFVFFDDIGQGLSLGPALLRGTGEIASPSDFYSGESIRVRVEKDRGFLVED